MRCNKPLYNLDSAMTIYPALTDRLKNQHEAIANILSTIDSNRLLIRPQPNKWNIQDNLAHLARYQPIFIDRIRKILEEDEPFFARYSAEEDAEFEYWREMDIETLMKQINIDRKDIVDLINDLSAEDINRIGVHKKYGSLTVLQWTEFFLLHEAHHIFTIFQLAYDIELR